MIGYNYPKLSYNSLVAMKTALETMVKNLDYPDVREQMQQVKSELETRKFRLIGKLDGKEVVEHGRYRTAEECKVAAEGIGTPVGVDFELRGCPFKTEIQPV
jgi:hypothetical protein